MKKIKFLILLCFVSTIVIAQRGNFSIANQYEFNIPVGLKSTQIITDTLVPESFIYGSPVLYTSDNSGYVFGANGYNDLGKAQLYIVDGSVLVHGLLVWFGVNEVKQGDLNFKVWSISDESFNEETSIAIPFSELVVPSEGAWYSILFENPAVASDMFLVGIEWSGLTDGFGIVSTTNGDAGGTDLALEKMEDSFWYSVLDSWELDVDLALFPFVSKSSESDAEIISFSFNEDYSTAQIDSENATVNSIVEKGTNIANLEPTIVVSPGAQVSGTVNDFSSPVELVVEAADGTTKNWTITVNESTVDVQSELKTKIKAYPNPVNNTLTLNNLQNVERIDLVSISGQLIISEMNKSINTTLDMQECKSGVYILKFYTNNGYQKFIKVIKD